MTRTRKITWTFATGLIFTALTLSLGFATTPFLLHLLSHERYGLFQLLLAWSGYLSLFELGLSGTLQALLSRVIGENNETATRSYFAAGFRAYIRMASIAILVAGLWVWLLPYLVSSSEVSIRELRWAGFLLAALNVSLPLTAFRWLADARQRSYVVNQWLIIQAPLITLLSVTAAWLGWGLIGLAAATVLAQLLFVVVIARDGLRDYPGIWRERPTTEASKAIWQLNWPTFAFNVCGRVGLLSDNLIIGWLIGPIAVAAFFLTQRLATLALGQLQGIGSATWAALVELHVQGQAESFRCRLLELTRLVSGLSFCILVPIAAYNRYFVELWVGAASFSGETVSVLACINVWLWALFSLWGWPISGTGNIRYWVPYALAGTVINVVVSVGATIKFGLIGPLLGTLTAFVLVHSWSLPLVLKRLFTLSPIDIWQEALASLTWGGAYCIAAWLVTCSHVPAGWFGVLGEMGLLSLVGLLLWWTFSLKPEARALWLSRMRLMLG